MTSQVKNVVSAMSGSRRLRSTKKRAEKSDDEETIEKEPKGSFAWSLMRPSQIQTLRNTSTPEELEERMAMTLNFEQHDVDLKEGCVVDFYVTIFHWGLEQKFDNRQLGGLMTLASKLIANIRDQNFTRMDNIKFVNECFVGVGSDNPEIVPIQLYFFTLQNAKDIIKYLFSTIFQHYLLYEFLFICEQDELIIGSDLSVNVCPEDKGPFPPPLEEAMPMEIYEMMTKEESRSDVASDPEELLQTDEMAEAVLNVVKESDNPELKEVTKKDVKNVLDKIIKEMVTPATSELHEKIKDKELSYMSKIAKIQIK